MNLEINEIKGVKLLQTPCFLPLVLSLSIDFLVCIFLCTGQFG